MSLQKFSSNVIDKLVSVMDLFRDLSDEDIETMVQN